MEGISQPKQEVSQEFEETSEFSMRPHQRPVPHGSPQFIVHSTFFTKSAYIHPGSSAMLSFSASAIFVGWHHHQVSAHK